MRWIVFFDGDCALCSGSIRLLARLDRLDHLRFSPLQGPLASEKNLSHFASEADGSMVIFRESDSAVFIHSRGWLELMNALGGPWRILTLLRIIPESWRDAAYHTIARNRYRWFGKKDVCELPGEAVRRRLL